MTMSEQQPEGERLTLSLTEVAELAGVRPGSVANWRKRHSDFPNPVIGPGRNRFFKDEIEDWLDSKGKRKKPTKETTVVGLLRSAVDVFDGHLQKKKDAINTSVFNNEGFLYNALRFITAYTADRITSDKKELSGAIGEILAEIQVLVENNPDLDLKGILHKVTLPLVASGLSISDLSDATTEVWVDDRRGSQTSLSAPWVTDAAIAQFLALLTKPSEEQINGVTIYDPCVGFGSTLLYSSALVNDATVIGQDVDSNIVGLASLCLSLKNCDATLSTVDSISGPVPNPSISADVVLAHPVLGMTVPLGAENDARWELGNPKGLLTNAWVQVVLRHLNQTGRGALIVEQDWLSASDKTSVDLRTNLLRRNVLDAVITIPKGFFNKSSNGFSIILFDKGRDTRQVYTGHSTVAFLETSRVQESSQGFAPVFTLLAALYLYWMWREDVQYMTSQGAPLGFLEAKRNLSDDFPTDTLQNFATSLAKMIFPSAGLTLNPVGEDIASAFENLQKHFTYASYDEIRFNGFSLDPKNFHPSLRPRNLTELPPSSDLISSLTQRVEELSELVTTLFPQDPKEEGIQNTPSTNRKLKEIADVVYWDNAPNPSFPNPRDKKSEVFSLGLRAWSQYITREGSGQVLENHKELFENQILPLGRFTAAIERRSEGKIITKTSEGLFTALSQLRDGSANIEPVLEEIEKLKENSRMRSPLINAGAWALKDFEDWEFLYPGSKGKTYLILDPNAEVLAEIHTEETVDLRRIKPNSAILAFPNELHAMDALIKLFFLHLTDEAPVAPTNRSYYPQKLSADLLEIDIICREFSSTPINFDSEKPVQITDHLTHGLVNLRSRISSVIEAVDQLGHFADELAALNPRAEMSRMLTLMEDYEKSGDMEAAVQIMSQLLEKDYMEPDNGE